MAGFLEPLISNLPLRTAIIRPTCIQEVFGSNSGQGPAILTEVFVVFLSPSSRNVRYRLIIHYSHAPNTPPTSSIIHIHPAVFFQRCVTSAGDAASKNN
jgi:hypothetical protein